MEMITRKDSEARRRFLALVIFLGLNAITGQVSASDTADFSVSDNVTAVLGETTDDDADDDTTDNDSKSNDSSRGGVNVSGTNTTITQSKNIYLADDDAVGILMEGSRNHLTIPKGTTINVSGLRGTGILISQGRGHNLDIYGNVLATSNAIEFDFSGNKFSNALVNNFNLWGTLTGDAHAIYIGEKSFVKNININAGAKIKGDIVSDWKISTATTGSLTDKYIPDFVTNLNINADFDYDGKIYGAENIKMNIKKGTMNFSGEANILSVDVALGAKLFGGMFTLNDMSKNIGQGYTDKTTGTFINHGTIGASSSDTNLIINGNLISDGILQKASGGKAGSIIVNGNANIEGSTVTTDSLLPNETATVLVANSITGNIKNPTGKPVAISGMLTATGSIVGNALLVTTHEANLVAILNSQEEKTLEAMNSMFENLTKEEQEQMRDFYNLEPNAVKDTLTEISSNDSAQIMSVAQQNTAVDKMISSRVSKVLTPEYIDVNITPMKFADGEGNAPAMKVKVKVPSRQENNFWLNYMKNWGSLRGGTDYHGSVIVGGYDKPIGKKWRAGIFATYGTIGYGADTSRATVYDTRLGLYAGYHNRANDIYIYANGGQLRNSLHRGIYSLGLSTNANYNSRIFELGGEYKYDLSPKKIWHVSPFINFQASHLKQSSYNEHGAGIYNQHVDANSNTYFAAQTGLDLKRYYKSGMLGLRFGVKHGFTGADPDLTISYEGDSEHRYRLRNKRDKTHFIFSLRGESEFERGWFLGGEAELQRSENDKDVTASVMLRRIW